MKRNQAHNNAGNYAMSSVVLICGSHSAQWHAMDDAVLVRDTVSAAGVSHSLSADAQMWY